MLGILPTLKQFPGHGDTAEDSHTALAVTYKTLDELQACELLPFAEDTGLHAVMVGHIAAPNVTGDGTPATLSPQLVALIPDAETPSSSPTRWRWMPSPPPTPPARPPCRPFRRAVMYF